MKIQLAPPSFWPEPRDPSAWQRVLRTLAADEPIADPRPCWEKRLEGTISRRSVPGLYGLRVKPAPALVIGCGLLTFDENDLKQLPDARVLLGDQWCDGIGVVETTAKPKSLAALASPLYLLHAMKWLSNDGAVRAFRATWPLILAQARRLRCSSRSPNNMPMRRALFLLSW